MSEAYLSVETRAVSYWSTRFQEETRTTSFLVGLLREGQVPCQRCGKWMGLYVLVQAGGERSFVCDFCSARSREHAAHEPTPGQVRDFAELEGDGV